MRNKIKQFLKIFREFVHEIFDDSSIHGFPYVVNRVFHIVENLLWAAMLAVGFLCAYNAFSGQRKRYEDNPTVLSVDIVSYAEFDRPAFTICTSNYMSNVKEDLAKQYFNVSEESPLLNSYVEFIEQVKELRYDTLQNLEPFENLPGVNDINLMEIAYQVYKEFLSIGPNFAKVMTERGMCQSTTKHYEMLLPLNNTSKKFARVNATMKVSDKCTSLEVCRISVTPNNMEDNATNIIFINSHDEVMTGDDLDYVELTKSLIQERHLKIDEIIADENIRAFKPKSRKCNFIDERQAGGYYDLYTPNFCKMNCRIRQALKDCGCVPFFYPVRNVKFCNVTGLICLSKKNWYDAKSCDCMNLCETTILTKLSSKQQNLAFDRMLTVDLVFPKIRIKRSVLFDFDDLLVGLGGSLALFLGLSFLCSVELVYHIIEYCIEMIINCVKY